jgi:hypothetical protein
MMPDLFDAVISLVPDANFCTRGDEIEWVTEPAIKPTKEELHAEIIRLQSIYATKEYQRRRALEYPKFTDYLDGIVKGDQAQIQSYIDSCLSVKEKYPKETV